MTSSHCSALLMFENVSTKGYSVRREERTLGPFAQKQRLGEGEDIHCFLTNWTGVAGSVDNICSGWTRSAAPIPLFSVRVSPIKLRNQFNQKYPGPMWPSRLGRRDWEGRRDCEGAEKKPCANQLGPRHQGCLRARDRFVIIV